MPDPEYQFVSRYLRKLGRWAPKIMQKYDLTTAIAIRPIIQPCTCKVGYPFSLPQINSNSRVWSVYHFQAYHQQIQQMEKLFSVAHGISYHSYPYSASTNEPGYYSLACACRHPLQRLQIWYQLWHQYVVNISPEWLRHLLSTIRPSPDVHTPLICFSPGVWDICSVHS